MSVPAADGGRVAPSSLRWRRSVGGLPLHAWALLGGLFVVIATFETLGWPFLAQPLQRLLSDTTGRTVSFTPREQAASAPGAAFSVRFIGGLRLNAAQIEIAAPVWSNAPHTLLAHDVRLALRYSDLWRAWRGQPLRIHSLQAAQLDADLEQLADGRASWQRSADAATAAAPPRLPSFGSLRLGAGTLRYRDVPLEVELQAQLSLDDAAAAAPQLQMQATGTWRGQPLQAKLSGRMAQAPGADAPDTPDPPLLLTLAADIGRASLQFEGRAAAAGQTDGFTGRFRLSGPSLAAVGDPLGVTLPTTGAFRASGWLAKESAVWSVRIDDATVGASRLNALLRYDAGPAVPLLSGRLGGNRLLLSDLGPVVGTAAPARGKGKVLPDRPFDLASLRAMDANVLIDIEHLDLDTRLLEPLRPLQGHLQLRGGVLSLDDLQARTGGGRLSGRIGLDGRAATAVWDAQLRWDHIELERWVRQVRAADGPPYVSGRWSGQAELQGQGVSTAQILGSLNGQVRSSLRGGSLSHLVVVAAGVDLAEALGLLFKGDESLPVTCAAADLSVKDGVLQPRVFVLDTPDSTAWIDGSLSLAQETLNLRVVVSPKDFSPLTLRTPLIVGGSFANPQLSAETGPLTLKLGAALLLGLLNPLAALIPLLDLGSAEEAQRGAADCRALSLRGKLKLAQGAKIIKP